MTKIFTAAFLLLPTIIFTQSPSDKLVQLKSQKESLQVEIAKKDDQIEVAKLEICQESLQKMGLPALAEGDVLINHVAMSLVYSEPHEQAKWVAHIITPDVMTGQTSRSNDFRIDPKVTTGTAVEKDYFLKTEYSDKPTEYDGFGYDRGHLAPSADFRWSKKALSESYFYSNMSPQVADFNRGIWGELENAMRGYIYRNETSSLYVVTGPILKENLPVIERSINKITIPEKYFKVVIDPVKGRGIGFLLPNKKSAQPLETFAMTIDEIEKLTGLDFYHGLPDVEENKLEADTDKTVWLTDLQEGNVEALTLQNVPRPRSYPTTFAKKFVGKSTEVNVCGTVVSGRIARSGNLILNLDKKYPNPIFNVFVRKENLLNFSYSPLELKGKQVCVLCKVAKMGSTPTMYIEDENAIEVIVE
ncbi:MAG: endonuclease G [Paraglaciecola sp.]|jgi:endonuclease G